MAPRLLEGINKVGVVIDDLTQKCCLSAQLSATAVVESIKIGIGDIKFKIIHKSGYWSFSDLYFSSFQLILTVKLRVLTHLV